MPIRQVWQMDSVIQSDAVQRARIKFSLQEKPNRRCDSAIAKDNTSQADEWRPTGMRPSLPSGAHRAASCADDGCAMGAMRVPSVGERIPVGCRWSIDDSMFLHFGRSFTQAGSFPLVRSCPPYPYWAKRQSPAIPCQFLPGKPTGRRLTEA